MKNTSKLSFIILIIGILGSSSASILVRYSPSSSVITATYRLFFTVLLMTPFVFSSKSSREELSHISKKTFLLSCLSGFVLAFHFYWWFESLKHTSVASSTAIVCTEVIWVALIYRFLLKGILPKKNIMAILITFSGSILVALSDSSGSFGHIYGDLLSLIAAVAIAIYTIIGRVARKEITTKVYTYIVYTSCAIVLCILAILKGENLFLITRNTLLIAILLAIFPTLLGHSIFSWCLKYFSPAFVAASKLCEPVVASLIALFLFQEVPKLLQITGGVIIILGVIYYSKIEAGQSAS